MRVALVNLRARTNDWHHIVMVPLGLLYVAAAVRRAFGDRVDVRLFDATVCPPGESTDDAIRAFLADARPDVVGIRGFSTQAAEFPIVAKLAKAVAPGCTVVAGGPHAATGSDTLYREPAIDWVCAAEGEETFVELLRAKIEARPTDGIAGLGRFDGTQTVSVPRRLIGDLDALPFPDYGRIDLDRYQGHITMTDFRAKGRYTSIFTSRGCHYRCTYCHDNFGKRVRYRSPEDVLREIAWLIERHGIEEFHIVDDIFNADKARAIEIFDGIVQRGWRIHLAFPNGLRADRMDEEFIAAASAAGAYHWALAVETATPRLQKLAQKMNKLDRVRETIRLSDRYDVFTTTFNMLGFPTETEAEMEATVAFNVESDAHVAHFFVVTPFEGTEMRERLDPEHLAHAPDAHTLGYTEFGPNGHHSLSTVPRARIQEILRDGVARFYFGTPRRIERMIALRPRAYDDAELAVHLGRRLHDVGLTPDTVPHPTVATRLREITTRATASTK